MLKSDFFSGFTTGNTLRRLLIVCLLFLPGACAQPGVKEESPIAVAKPIQPTSWPAAKKQRMAIRSWELRGRLGVQTENNSGTLDLIWQQDGDEYVIRLLAPMGQGTYLISGNEYSAVLRLPNGKKRIISNPDALFNDSLGVDLPLSALRDWVRGIPASSLPVDKIRWNKKGLLRQIDQNGWHVEMSNYLGNKVLLPYKIYLSREDNPDLSIRLALRQWMIDN